MYGMLPESKPSGRWLNPIDDTLVAYPHNSKPLARRRRKKPLDQPPAPEPQEEDLVSVSRNSFMNQSSTEEVSYDSKLPKQVQFFRNGDKFYKGKKIRITPQRYLSLDGLLSDLTKAVSLPYGVRKLYTPNGGTEVKRIEEIKDGRSYVCASFEKFKKLKYGAARDQNWKTTRKTDPGTDFHYGQSMASSYPAGGKYATAYGKSKGRTEPIPFQTGQKSENIPADSRSLPPKYLSSLNNKPKLIKIVKAGKKPYQSVSLLLNRKSILSLEHLMQDISEAFGLPNHRNYKICKLYSAKGDEISGVGDFFRDQDSVVIGATARNPVTGDELVQILEEVLPNSLLSRKLRNKQLKEHVLKADSGIENDDDVSSQDIPSLFPPRGRKGNRQRADKVSKPRGVKLAGGGDQREIGVKLDIDDGKAEAKRVDVNNLTGVRDSSPGKVGDNRVSVKEGKKGKGIEGREEVEKKMDSRSPRITEEASDSAVNINIKKNLIVQDETEKVENKKDRTRKKVSPRDGKRKKQDKRPLDRVPDSEEAPSGESKKAEKPKEKREVREAERKQKKSDKQKRRKSSDKEDEVSNDLSQSGLGIDVREDKGVDEEIDVINLQEGEEADDGEGEEDVLAKLLSTTAQDEAKREIFEGLQVDDDDVRESKTQESSIPEELDFRHQDSKVDDTSSESKVDFSSKSKVEFSPESNVDVSSEFRVDLPSDSKVDFSYDDKGFVFDAKFGEEEEEEKEDKPGDELVNDVESENGKEKELLETTENETSKSDEFIEVAKEDDEVGTDGNNADSLDDRLKENSSPNRDFEFSGKSGQFVIRPRQICSDREVLERYRLGEKVGDGNFADVHAGVLRSTGEEFAIKKVDKSKLKGKESMIENEIAILKEIDHPNIVKLYEEFETDDYIYLIMDYIRGGDLFDAIIDSVKFTEADASVMVRDLARALDYLHKMNVVHRDMKPENLLVNLTDDSKMQLKLADFGLAMEVVKPVYTVCGTPTYVAPEILAETGYGLPVDMWALGVITYILLCGFPPFRSPDRSQDELFDLIQAGKYEYIAPYWNSISKSAKDLIDNLLVVDQKKRFTAVEVLQHPWVKGGERNNSVTNLQREVSINLEKNFSRPSSSKR